MPRLFKISVVIALPDDDMRSAEGLEEDLSVTVHNNGRRAYDVTRRFEPDVVDGPSVERVNW